MAAESIDMDRVLIGDLGQDALLYVKRVLRELSHAAQAEILESMNSGVEIEVRVRMRGATQPRFSVAPISETGEMTLHSTHRTPASRCS